MKVIDPGHFYELDHLDGKGKSLLRFVKRTGDKYPGNEPPGYEGVTIQEVLRALIERMIYVNNQDPSEINVTNLSHLRTVLYLLEKRAAERRGDSDNLNLALCNFTDNIELAPVCSQCGHIGCTVHGKMDL